MGRIRHIFDNNVLVFIIEIFFIISIFAAIITSASNIILFEIKENQVMYCFSAGVQVIAGLFGLTIAGNVFYNNRLDKKVEDDMSLDEAVADLKARNYQLIRRIGVGCFFSISLVILNIVLYSPTCVSSFYKYIFNQSVFFLFLEIAYIISFAFKTLNPKEIDKTMRIGINQIELEEKKKASEVEKKEVETDESSIPLEELDIFEKEEGSAQEKKSSVDNINMKVTEEEVGSLGAFLKYYNIIESIIMRTVQDLLPNEFDQHEAYSPKVVQAMDRMQYLGVVSRDTVEEFHTIRKYRNFTVHNQNPTISEWMYNKIVRFYRNLSIQIGYYYEEKRKSHMEWLENKDRSSAIQRIAYDGADLYVEYSNGSIYQYYGVPKSVYIDLANTYSISHGSGNSDRENIFNKLIRNAGYSYKRLNS